MSKTVNIPNPNKTVISLFTQTRFNPAANSTYYFSNVPNPSPQTVETNGSTICPVNLTLKKLKGVVTHSAGPALDVSFYVTIDSVYHLIQTVQLTSTRTLITKDDFDLSIPEDAKLSIKMVTPNPYGSPPINFSGSFNLYCI